MTDETDRTATCDNCGTSYPEERMRNVLIAMPSLLHTNGLTAHWCPTCVECSTVYCRDTSPRYVAQSLADTYLYWHEGAEEWHDYEEEIADDDDDSGALYEYGTNVLRIHGWPARTDKQSLCFGVELEMEAKRRAEFDTMLALLEGKGGNGRYILKYDGSLEDGKGAELVTLPYTLADHQRYFGWRKVLTDTLRDVAHSGSGTTNCGLHVHVNRAALSPLTIGKMLVFLNSPTTARLVTCIAQRSNGTFASRDENKNILSERKGDFNRYDILNVGNGGTVEFRMFRGNLRPERVLKAVEFCHALVMFCRDTGINDVADAGALLTFVKKRAADYPHLLAFLVEKNWLPAPASRSTAPYATILRDTGTEQRADA